MRGYAGWLTMDVRLCFWPDIGIAIWIVMWMVGERWCCRLILLPSRCSGRWWIWCLVILSRDFTFLSCGTKVWRLADTYDADADADADAERSSGRIELGLRCSLRDDRGRIRADLGLRLEARSLRPRREVIPTPRGAGWSAVADVNGAALASCSSATWRTRRLSPVSEPELLRPDALCARAALEASISARVS